MPRSAALLLLLLAPISLPAAEGAGKKVLSLEDYGRWRSIRSASISDRGDWITFAYSERDKDPELHIKHLDSDKDHKIARGAAPQLSDDSRFAAYRLEPPVKKGGSGRRDDDAKGSGAKSAVELLDLESGDKVSWEGARSFRFSKGSKVLVVQLDKPSKDQKHDGTPLILRDLRHGTEELIGCVSSWSFSKSGDHLAYVVDAPSKNGNGLYLIDLDSGRRRALDNHKAKYARMTWDEDGLAIAVLRGEEDDELTERVNSLIAFRHLDQSPPVRSELKPDEAFGFPRDMVISEKSSLTFSDDRARVWFGIKEQKKKPKKDGKKDEDDKPADVDIWHWDDERLQSVQKIRASRDRDFTWRSIFHLEEGKFVRLCDEEMRSIDLTRDGRFGVGRDQRAYVSDWKQSRSDLYRVDTATGERELLLEAQPRTLGLSPDSKQFLYWKDGHVHAYPIARGGEHKNLTADAPVSFINEEFDRFGEKPAYGVTGYTKDGQAVILSSRYDLWRVPFDGGQATNLTQGKGSQDEIRFRYIRVDDDERSIDTTAPMLLSAYGQWTKKAGYYRLHDGTLTRLLFVDKRMGRGVRKAKEADRYLFTIEDFQEFPDYYVCGADFDNPRRVTDANPQQMEYRWGRRILFDYTNKDGVRLQGTLGIPDGHVEGERLPMLVNFYEKNSQNLHRYPTPRYGSSPQFAAYLSDGWLVMQPDVHFNTRTSHLDMLDCVEAAVKKTIEMGYTDPGKVALHGHSYSGQGAAFIATQSKMFAAVIAGAAATNLISDFNQLWKSAGTNQHNYDIHGQGRFAANPFDDLELYRAQSAVYHARSMDTPLLLLHGTEDGAVEWLQAIEFYNALRFNGKEVILLSYPGEGHGLRKSENQKDFQRRAKEFLEHHVRGKEAAEWIRRGRSYLDKQELLGKD